MENYSDLGIPNDIYDDRLERHFLMQLVKQDILSDENGDYVIYEEKKLLVNKPHTFISKIGYNY